MRECATVGQGRRLQVEARIQRPDEQPSYGTRIGGWMTLRAAPQQVGGGCRASRAAAWSAAGGQQECRQRTSKRDGQEPRGCIQRRPGYPAIDGPDGEWGRRIDAQGVGLCQLPGRHAYGIGQRRRDLVALRVWIEERISDRGHGEPSTVARRDEPIEFFRAPDFIRGRVQSHALLRRNGGRPGNADRGTRKQIHISAAGDADGEAHRVAHARGGRIEVRRHAQVPDGTEIVGRTSREGRCARDDGETLGQQRVALLPTEETE